MTSRARVRDTVAPAIPRICFLRNYYLFGDDAAAFIFSLKIFLPRTAALGTGINFCDSLLDTTALTVGAWYFGCVPRIKYVHCISSVCITSLPTSVFPYSVGVKETIKVVLSQGSRSTER